ncbi:hypothetical protein MCQ_01283 [Candidatus Bartonella washoeensis Sb944nv]|uniref:Uncharacterized protein n=2 Tax=Candidatus Bartonella washoeensis TaxID=186739 RepID=J0ZFG0_9HYPH|nr:hypothetical protein [Bartonella washoeensis]EJF78563.1 hypothetical protein MCQ_01283 [Bartonella washoeensis Sb944nv]EJF86788.1 hypothetical protein MCW_00011 [Bartonella washoeensis 085-0475]
MPMMMGVSFSVHDKGWLSLDLLVGAGVMRGWLCAFRGKNISATFFTLKNS